MAKKAVVVNGAIATTGTFDITSSGFGTVDGAIIMMSMATATNTDTNTNSTGIAFYDGTDTLSYSSVTLDNQSKTSSRRITTTSCSFIGTSASVDYVASISKITDGIRCTFTDDPSAAFRYTAILFGGGVALKTGYVIASASIDGTSAYTGADFTPQAAIVVTSGAATFTTDPLASFTQSYGIFTYNGETISQRGYHVQSNHNANDDEYVSITHNERVAYRGGASYEVTAVSSSGFTVTTRDVASAAVFPFMLIGGVQDVHLGDTPIPTSTGVKSWEGPGFQPQFLLNVQTGMESYNSTSTTEDCCYSVGWTDGTTSGSISGWGDDGAATTDTGSRTNTALMQSYQTTYADKFTASFDSFDSAGYYPGHPVRVKLHPAGRPGRRPCRLFRCRQPEPGQRPDRGGCQTYGQLR